MPDEGARLMYMLREIRCTQEVIASVDAAAAVAAAATAQANAEPHTMSVNVVTIPEGHYWQADGSFQPLSPDMLQLEHTPSAPPPEPKPQLDEPEPEQPVRMYVSPPPERDDGDGVIYMRSSQRTPRPPRRPSWG